MPATTEQIGSLLHEAGDTHHRVFRLVDGADDDWASWYAWWLINLSELPDLLGFTPVRSCSATGVSYAAYAVCFTHRP